MSDVFIVDLFIFKSTKITPYFAASNQHLTCMSEYIKHMILNTFNVFYIYTCTTHIIYIPLVYFTLYPLFSFLSLCVSKCVA